MYTISNRIHKECTKKLIDNKILKEELLKTIYKLIINMKAASVTFPRFLFFLL